MKILVADDDRELSDILSFALSRAGFAVVTAADGEQALARFRSEQPALVLLDVSMPRLDGFEVCRRLRAESAVPILMLTVRDEEEEILRAFDLGADDYVTKPFSPKQLVARIKAALRRGGADAPVATEAGPLRLDPERHEVSRPGAAAIGLTPLEFRLLQVLVANRGRVVPADELVAQVWECQRHVGDRALLKGLVRRLRQKVEPDPGQPAWIQTVAGIGYTVGS